MPHTTVLDCGVGPGSLTGDRLAFATHSLSDKPLGIGRDYTYSTSPPVLPTAKTGVFGKLTI